MIFTDTDGQNLVAKIANLGIAKFLLVGLANLHNLPEYR